MLKKQYHCSITSYGLIVIIAIVSEVNLRFGNFSQTLVILQVI